MENKEIRRANLQRLVAEFHSAAKLADRANTDPAYLSQIKNKIRDMGDELARKLEKAADKEMGWMDQPHQPVGRRRSLSEENKLYRKGGGILSKDEEILVEKYRQMPSAIKTHYQEIGDTLAPKKINRKEKDA